MQRLGHNFFAGAMLAGDQHIGVTGADAAEQRKQRLHGLGFGDEYRTVLRAQQVVFRLQPLGAADDAVQIHLRADNAEQALVVPGFLDEITGAPAHGLHRKLHAAPGSHHHDRHFAVHGLHTREQIHAFLSGSGIALVIEVHQDNVELVALQGLKHGGGIVGRFGVKAFSLEQQAQGLAHVLLVVCNKDANAVAGSRRGAYEFFGFGQLSPGKNCRCACVVARSLVIDSC